MHDETLCMGKEREIYQTQESALKYQVKVKQNMQENTKYSYYWKCKYCNMVNDWKDKTCSYCGSPRGKATVRHTDRKCVLSNYGCDREVLTFPFEPSDDIDKEPTVSNYDVPFLDSGLRLYQACLIWFGFLFVLALLCWR